MPDIPGSTYRTKDRIRKRRRSSISTIMIVFLCVMIGVFSVYQITNSNKQMTPQKKDVVGYQTTSSPQIKKLVLNVPINSTNAVLMDFENGAILFAKKGTEKMFPASMTKIMTAVVVLEHIDDLNVKVLLNNTMFQSIYNKDASMAGFLPGQNVRVIDLLYGLLLPSGAECSIGLAEYVAGSENAFVTLMNDKARELGMVGSHFTNTTGLHDNNLYSTAKDMAILLRYALKNNTFYKIITSSQYSTPAINKQNRGITFDSTLFSRIDSSVFDGGKILGGKTGFTNEAGQCLASFAIKDGKKYILVTSGARGDNETQKQHIDDAFTVYDNIGR